MEGYHRSVLLGEVVEALEIKEGKWYLDCTLGDGGHALQILRSGGNVLGLDVDPQALERAKERLQATGYREQDFKLIQGNFRDIKNLIPASTAKRGEQTETKFAGVLFDLGVSSLQLESPERGFSFSKMGPLDMRMDPSLEVKALDLIKGLNKGELNELFTKLGEEKFARALAETLVSTREIGTTKDLAGLVENVYRRHGIKRWKIHPATKVFQALRIAVNDELNALKEGLEESKDLIQNHGHILVISFHSLEDRIVKLIFTKWEAQGLGRVVTKKPIVPTKIEILQNPRARSAKMRVFEKS